MTTFTVRMCTVIACAVHVFYWSDGTCHASLAKRKIIVCDSCCCYSLNCPHTRCIATSSDNTARREKCSS